MRGSVSKAWMFGVGLGLLSATGAVAQSQDLSPSGFRVGASLAYTNPFVAGGRSAFDGLDGQFAGATALSVELGYDWERLGLSLMVEGANPEVAGQETTSLNMGALLHWRPAVTALEPWRLESTFGIVRSGVSGVDIAAEDRPGTIFEDPSDPQREIRDVGVRGNGFRVGLGIERTLIGRLALGIGVSSDLVWYNEASLNGFDRRVDDPGLTMGVRLDGRIRWWPF